MSTLKSLWLTCFTEKLLLLPYSFLSKEMVNKYQMKTIIKNYKKILITIMPILPHIASECLQNIDKNIDLNWPNYEEKFIKNDSNIIVIQINGKKRGLINAKPNLNEEDLIKNINIDKNLSKYLIGKKIKKKIFIKNKLINLII